MKHILLSGPDGVGKSTISDALQSYYKSNSIAVGTVWLRFHHYFQKGVNFMGRLLGKSYDEKYGWGTDNYHDYTGVFGVFYLIAAYIDFYIFLFFIKSKKIRKKETIYIIDRYIIDIVADLIVDTRNEKLVFILFDRFIQKELKNLKPYILECDTNIVISRRDDIRDDKKYNDKIEAFNLISNRYNIQKLNTGETSIDEIVKQIIN
jgi:hypothetical protein